MTTVYPAIIHEEEGYWVEFPDLSGCFTNGSTLEETMEMAKEALGLYLVSLEENGQAIPAPSNIADISTDEGQTTYISTDMNAYRRDTQAIKKNAVHSRMAGKRSRGKKYQFIKSITRSASLKNTSLICLEYYKRHGKRKNVHYFNIINAPRFPRFPLLALWLNNSLWLQQVHTSVTSICSAGTPASRNTL